MPHVSAGERHQPLRSYAYVYGGAMVHEGFPDIPAQMFSLHTLNSTLVVVGGGKELKHFGEYLTVEAEGQIAQHLGHVQNHTEANALISFRWQPFYWDRWLDTSLAWGIGLSMASQKPQAEIDELGDSARMLAYMSLEVDFLVPGQDDWSLFTRIHHRSGVFGLIDDISGGSDAVTIGMKKRF